MMLPMHPTCSLALVNRRSLFFFHVSFNVCTMPSPVVDHLIDPSPSTFPRLNGHRFNGLVVMISVLHTEGLQFDPGLNHFLPATMERPLNVTDALSYLDDVKAQFQDQPDVYNHFLDIMKDFKSQLCDSRSFSRPRSHPSSIDTPGVIKRVSYLFNGRPSLIQGFNAFLPIGYHIECSTDPLDANLITVTTPTGTMMQTTNNNGPGPSGLMWSTSDAPRSTDAYGPSSFPRSVHPSHSLPPDNEDTPNFQMLDPQLIEPAIQYVRKIKESCEPDVYRQFLAILHRYHGKPDAVDEVRPSLPSFLLSLTPRISHSGRYRRRSPSSSRTPQNSAPTFAYLCPTDPSSPSLIPSSIPPHTTLVLAAEPP